eukprot:TRINITY_DN43789_c0_g1_i1.p1 TRINITY_DN43789_c0_g1~~TRINITY_DN43789_c0_g1_i1.p1  ORF type:complete len:572 (-),score=100.51 TRINITY_DN43789_c0_g1_i1:277-1992(-)
MSRVSRPHGGQQRSMHTSAYTQERTGGSHRHTTREADDYGLWGESGGNTGEGATSHLRTSAYDRRASSSRRQADADDEFEDTWGRSEFSRNSQRNTGCTNHASQRRATGDSLRHSYGSERNNYDDHTRENINRYNPNTHARDVGSTRSATAANPMRRRDDGDDDDERHPQVRSSAYSRRGNNMQPPPEGSTRRRNDEDREDHGRVGSSSSYPSPSDSVQHRPSSYSKQRDSTDRVGYENPRRQNDREDDRSYGDARSSRHLAGGDSSWQNDRETEQDYTWGNQSGWNSTHAEGEYRQWRTWQDESNWEGDNSRAHNSSQYDDAPIRLIDAKASWPARDEQNYWKNDSTGQWTDDRPRGGSNINFDARGSNLTCSRDLIKKVRAGDTSQNADPGSSPGRKQSESDSSSSSKSQTRKKKKKRKKRSSSSTSSSSNKSLQDKEALQDKEEENRINKIKNAARINRIKKRREAAKESAANNDLVVVEAKASESTQAAGETPAQSTDQSIDTSKSDKPDNSALSIDAAKDDLVVVEAKTSASIQPAGGGTPAGTENPVPDASKSDKVDLSVVSIDD